MKIVVDHRESDLITELNRTLECQDAIELCVENLDIGDITIQTDNPVFIIERKSVSDLLSSIKDGRYEEQCHRLTHADSLPQHHKMYLIEGKYNTLPIPQQKLVLSAITSLIFFKGFSVFRTDGILSTANFIIHFAEKIGRDLAKGRPVHFFQTEHATPTEYVNVVKRSKKQNITSDNIGAIMLCQIPGVSNNIATALMEGHASFGAFVRAVQDNPTCIDGITITAGDKRRKVSKTIIDNVKTYFSV